MATMQQYRTARTAKPCDDFLGCSRGIKPGERYERAVATPNDSDLGNTHWWTLNICCDHMKPEPVPALVLPEESTPE